MPIAARLLIALLALLVGGCSLTKEQPTDPDKRRPLKVQHARGETRVPFLSDRSATVDPAALETAVALGATPLGATSWNRDGSQPRYLRRATADVEPLGYAPAPDLPVLRRLDPDVIIGNDLFQKRLYDRLAEIAPTVYSGIPLKDWKGDVRFFGESLGRSDQGEQLLIDYDGRVAHARRAIGDDPPAIVRLPPDLRDYLDQSFVDAVMADVGIRAGAAQAAGHAGGIIAAYRLLDVVERQAAR